MRKINEIIVHCSYTRPGMDVGAEWIRNIHVNENGWNDIGYHFVIRRDGTFENGRHINLMGAHCKGHNRNSIGICIIGGMSENNLPENNFTPEQFNQLRQTVSYLQRFFPEITSIRGHRDYDTSKTCPCFDVNKILKA